MLQDELLGPNSLKVTLPVGVPPALAEIVAESCGDSDCAVEMPAGAFVTMLDSPASPHAVDTDALLPSPL